MELVLEFPKETLRQAIGCKCKCTGRNHMVRLSVNIPDNDLPPTRTVTLDTINRIKELSAKHTDLAIAGILGMDKNAVRRYRTLSCMPSVMTERYKKEQGEAYIHLGQVAIEKLYSAWLQDGKQEGSHFHRLLRAFRLNPPRIRSNAF